jgi:hypothetical protein
MTQEIKTRDIKVDGKFVGHVIADDTLGMAYGDGDVGTIGYIVGNKKDGFKFSATQSWHRHDLDKKDVQVYGIRD